MKKSKIFNALIEDVFLGIESHGILTFSLGLHFDKCHYQGFGDVSLGGQGNWKREPNIGGRAIFRILAVLEKSDFTSLKGTALRAKEKNGRIVAIGHFFKDKWFYPEEEFNNLSNNNENK